MGGQRRTIFSVIKAVSDIMVIYVSFCLGYWFRFVIAIPPITKGTPPFTIYEKLIPLVIVVWMFVFYHFDFYNWKKVRLKLDEFFNVIKGVSVGTVILLAGTFFYREISYSRVMITYTWVVSIVLIYLVHEIINIIEGKIKKRRVLVIGNGKIAQGLGTAFNRRKNVECRFANKIPQDLRNFVKRGQIEEVLLAKLAVGHQEVLDLHRECEEVGVNFKFLPDILELRMGEISINNYFGFPVLELKPIALVGANRVAKRLFDVVFGMVILCFTAIPGLIIATLIKLDSPGSVLYKQPRKGWRGKTFTFLKFRTMLKGSEKLLEELKPKSERSGPVFKMKRDPRITRLGRFLRKYSLDELPQILNVIRGEMSLVGPRPQVLWETEHYDQEAKRRLHILPGITGLWQVRGRCELGYEKMIELDIWYLENWSLALDVKILLATIPAVLSSRGAY